MSAPSQPFQINRRSLLEKVATRAISPAKYVILSWLIDELWAPDRPYIPLTQTQLADTLDLDRPTTRAALRALRNAGVLRMHTNNSTGRGKIVINPSYVKPFDEKAAHFQHVHWMDLA